MNTKRKKCKRHRTLEKAAKFSKRFLRANQHASSARRIAREWFGETVNLNDVIVASFNADTNIIQLSSKALVAAQRAHNDALIAEDSANIASHHAFMLRDALRKYIEQEYGK